MGRLHQFTAVLSLIVATATNADAQTCIEIEKFRGHSAFSDDGYAFSKDAMSADRQMFCHDDEIGTLDSNPNAVYMQLAAGVWIWAGGIDGITETAEILTFDLHKRVALLARVRAATNSTLFGPTAGAFVGTISAVITR